MGRRFESDPGSFVNIKIMAIDLTKIYKEYRGFWVALKDNGKIVVAVARTAKAVLRKAKKKGVDQPILFKLPDKVVPYVGSFNL